MHTPPTFRVKVHRGVHLLIIAIQSIGPLAILYFTSSVWGTFSCKGVTAHLKEKECARKVFFQIFGAELISEAFCISAELIKSILSSEWNAVDSICLAP